MARKRGFFEKLAAAQREAERHKAQVFKAQTQAVKEANRAQQAYLKAQESQRKALVTEQKQRNTELKIAQVELQNAQIEQTIAQLSNLLLDTIAVDDYIDLENLKQNPNIPPFNPGNLATPLYPPVWQNYIPPEPAGMQKMIPGAKQKYTQDLAMARQRYEADFARYSQAESQRQAVLNQHFMQYKQYVQQLKEKADAHNREIDEFQTNLKAGDAEAITSYCSLVLEASAYPDGFPQKAKLAYQPESKQLVVEYYLPGVEVVPSISSYKYVKTGDKITETTRPLANVRQIYSSVVAQLTLRTIHELFEADRLGHLDVIVFNGVVETIDKSTGRTISPCLITVRVTDDVFGSLNLSRVEPLECLKNLNAGVSKSPAELAPVRPVLEFNMVDPRFIQETDVLAGLDQRQNLMELTPSEFESLITNLFQKIGLDAKLTQASRDGGVDCVAYDPRPVLGGKVIIQAKRYKDTVGVSAVRDLYGAVHNEGASKGILVTTSGYGKAAYDFAQGKPLELLDGANLLYLLKEHGAVEAKIEMPSD